MDRDPPPYSDNPQPEACRNLIVRGCCKFGNDCLYSHDIAPTSSKAANKNSVKKYHICPSFSRYGFCRASGICLFSHDPEHAKLPVSPVHSRSPRSSERDSDDDISCGHFRSGVCRVGASCSKPHNRLKYSRKRNVNRPRSPILSSDCELSGPENCLSYRNTGWCDMGDKCKKVHRLRRGVQAESKLVCTNHAIGRSIMVSSCRKNKNRSPYNPESARCSPEKTKKKKRIRQYSLSQSSHSSSDVDSFIKRKRERKQRDGQSSHSSQ
eukprot:381597_1